MESRQRQPHLPAAFPAWVGRGRQRQAEAGTGRHRVVGIALLPGSCSFICKTRGSSTHWTSLDLPYGDLAGLDVEVWDWIISKRPF